MRIKSFLTAAVLSAASISISIPAAAAHEYDAGPIHIEHPWTRATPPKAEIAGAYMRLENKGHAADRLLSAASPAADHAEIHRMDVKDGVMTMRPLAEGLDVPPGETVALAPGGLHIMLVGLARPLKEGERVPLTLTFAKAGTVTVELAVDAMGAKGADHGDMAHAGHAGHAEGEATQ